MKLKASFHIRSLYSQALEGVLNCDLSAIVLAEHGTHNGAGMLAKSVPCNIIRDVEQHERVQDNVKVRARLTRHERVRSVCRHNEMSDTAATPMLV